MAFDGGDEGELPELKYNVSDLAIDHDNRLWIGYLEQGVHVLDFGEYESLEDDELIHYDIIDGLPSSTIHAVHVASDGRAWVGTGAGLAVQDRVTGEWTTVASLADVPVSDLDEDSQGHVWAATDQGVAMVYRSGEETYVYGTPDGLADEEVSLIAVDESDGTVWAVTIDDETEDTHLNVLESGFGPESSVFAYPNPWRQGAAVGIRILGAPDGSSVEVLDIAGNSMRKLTAGAEPFEWDSLDDSGNEVPSGVYIIRVEGADGTSYFTKVAIIR
jgi:hypothetical protein